MTRITISMKRDFSSCPAGRYKSDGDYSGEAFREMLVKQLKLYAVVTIDLDGTRGYSSSFLEEAFGGLVKEGFSLKELDKKLKVKSSNKGYINEIWEYIKGEVKNG